MQIANVVRLPKHNFRWQYKLCRVKRDQLGPKGVPFVVTHDGRTFRFPDPLIKVNDTVKVDLVNNKVTSDVFYLLGCRSCTYPCLSSDR